MAHHNLRYNQEYVDVAALNYLTHLTEQLLLLILLKPSLDTRVPGEQDPDQYRAIS